MKYTPGTIGRITGSPDTFYHTFYLNCGARAKVRRSFDTPSDPPFDKIVEIELLENSGFWLKGTVLQIREDFFTTLDHTREHYPDETDTEMRAGMREAFVSRRERIATAIMAGILADDYSPSRIYDLEKYAEEAADAADALIKELDK